MAHSDEVDDEAIADDTADVEADADATANDGESWERPVDRFRRSATGSVVAAGLFGLRDALEGRPEREEVTIVSEAPTRPVDEHLEVVLDFEHPERSTVVVHGHPDRETGSRPSGE